jgi:hypothetical protein
MLWTSCAGRFQLSEENAYRVMRLIPGSGARLRVLLRGVPCGRQRDGPRRAVSHAALPTGHCHP